MKILFFSASFFLVTITWAQEDYLITLKGDTIFGSITLYQNTYFDEALVKNEEGKERYKSYEILTISRPEEAFDPIAHKGKRVFGKQVIKGPLSLYLVKGENNQFSEEVLIREDGESSYVPTIGFKKVIASFLASCPALASKIEEKALSKPDLDKIIAEYNQCDKTATVSDQEQPNDRIFEFAALLVDLESKIKTGEKIPIYMKSALEEYQGTDLNEMLSELLKLLR
ncbi:MAG: hypothetical protein AAF616_12030 [Bacteroidota bacterium]